MTEEKFITEDEQEYNADDPKTVNDARKKAKRLRQKRIDFVRRMMSDHDGRMWVYDLITSCHVFGNPLIMGDPYATHFNIGMTNVGKLILMDINEAAPDKYMQMIEEGKNEK